VLHTVFNSSTVIGECLSFGSIFSSISFSLSSSLDEEASAPSLSLSPLSCDEFSDSKSAVSKPSLDVSLFVVFAVGEHIRAPSGSEITNDDTRPYPDAVNVSKTIGAKTSNVLREEWISYCVKYEVVATICVI